jgi:ABC-2 type transport system ATP-binding protein
MNGKGVTFILTTHDMEDIERLARRVIVVNHGAIVFDDALEALRDSLGGKKIVRLATRLPVRLPDVPGLAVLRRTAPCAVELELDVGRLDLNRFMALIGQHNAITDLAIEALPIERAVRELYCLQPDTTAHPDRIPSPPVR